MTTSYTSADWPVALKEAHLISNTPDELAESTTLTSNGVVTTDMGEYENIAGVAARLLQVPKSEISS